MWRPSGFAIGWVGEGVTVESSVMQERKLNEARSANPRKPVCSADPAAACREPAYALHMPQSDAASYAMILVDR